MGRIAFIIGAGFGVDAGSEIGPIHVEHSMGGPYDYSCRYPLVSDLIRLCYPNRTEEVCSSVEEWFQESLLSQNYEPLRRLYEDLMWTDWNLVPRLIPEGEQVSSYGRFLKTFKDADFITFNYDSFIELSLLRMKRWIPRDGYGVPVAAGLIQSHENKVPAKSQNLVVHLHGSLCVYESRVSISKPDQAGVRRMRLEMPQYILEPGSLGELFLPWSGQHKYESGPIAEIEERVIAPVPEKTVGLKRDFIEIMRSRALELVRNSDSIVAIGFRFNPVDEESFRFLLSAIAERSDKALTVVSPSAMETTARLAKSYPDVLFRAIQKGFASWAATGFDLAA
ncbi:MAG: hypothetical protein ABJC13_01280 [Acidobacteriota bacterium]